MPAQAVEALRVDGQQVLEEEDGEQERKARRIEGEQRERILRPTLLAAGPGHAEQGAFDRSEDLHVAVKTFAIQAPSGTATATRMRTYKAV